MSISYAPEVKRYPVLLSSSLQSSVRISGTAKSDKSTPSIKILSTNEWIVTVSMVALGSAMQAYANRAFEAVLVALLFLVVGLLAVGLLFPSKVLEKRAFLLTYAMCLFVGGLAQSYSLAIFNVVQSTVDAPKFLWYITLPPGYESAVVDLSAINAPLAINIWRQVYKLTEWLGFQFGPYTGVMFNAAVIGIVGSLIVQIVRELFGEDDWRLRRAGTLAASNGLFILFGAILIRDAFTTFFTTLVLWWIVRWLVRSTLQTLLFAAALTILSSWAMAYLRAEAVTLFALYWVLAFLLWLFRRFNAIRLVVAAIILFAILVASPYITAYLQDSQKTQTSELEKYLDLADRTSSEDSLGIQLVYNQPLPIRLVMGIGVQMINPIPLWTNFQIASRDYHWIKGYHGIYQVLVMPQVFAGALAAFRLFRIDRKRGLPFVFLVMYLLVNTVSVVATSMEQRHLGQFMAAMIAIAVIQDTRQMKIQSELKIIRTRWLVAVYLVHLIWLTIKVIL